MSLLDATGDAFRLLFGGDLELWGIVFISLKVAGGGGDEKKASKSDEGEEGDELKD